MATFALLPSYVTVGGINLSSQEDSGVMWVLETFKGWGRPQGTLAPVQKPRAAGAWAGISYAHARSMTITGTVTGPDAATTSDALDRLIAALGHGDQMFTVSESGRIRWAYIRRDGELDATWLSATAFTYAVQIVALDPRKYGTQLSVATSPASSSGGLTVAYSVPYSIASSGSNGQVTLTNPGNEVGPVSFYIGGQCVGPIVTQVGTGLALGFSPLLTVPSGQTITVDNEARQVLANGQAARNGYISSRGWQGFQPGVNTWAFSATSFGTDATLTVVATPAWK